MGQGEIVGGEPALVDVGHHHVEAHFGEFHVGVGCHEGVVAEHGFALVVEGGCGGLVGGGVVACIVVAVEAELEVEGGYAGADVEAGAQGELGKGEDGASDDVWYITRLSQWSMPRRRRWSSEAVNTWIEPECWAGSAWVSK